MRKLLAVGILGLTTTAQAYLGSFDPQPLRNSVVITFVDSQLPGPQCVAEEPAITAPLVLTAVGCAIYNKGLVIVPISPGIGWINAAQILATPDALLGHETRHLFDGDFHPIALPWFERVRSPSDAAGSVVSGDKHD